MLEAENITLEYKDGKILTPDGKKFSHLPEMYAKVVRTPTFLSWFGDWTKDDKTNASKIVYPDTGEPALVFHGTKTSVGLEGLQPQPNDRPSLDNKVWFAEKIDLARQYAGYRFDSYNKEMISPAKSMFMCFVRIVNPADIARRHFSDDVTDPEKERWTLRDGEDGFIMAGGKLPTDSYSFIVASSEQLMHCPSSLEHHPHKED